MDFITFYEDYVVGPELASNKTHEWALNAFKSYARKSFIAMSDLNEDYCKAFRVFLMRKFNGVAPALYFKSFKKSFEKIY